MWVRFVCCLWLVYCMLYYLVLNSSPESSRVAIMLAFNIDLVVSGQVFPEP